MTAATAPAPSLALSDLPSGAEVGELLEGLLDRGVTAAEEARPVLVGRDVRMVATYADDTGSVRAVVMLDVSLSAVLGAALALVPPHRVASAVEDGAVPADLADNTREVLNIAASLFNCGDVHLKLREVAVAPQPVDDATVAFLRRPSRRADRRVDVPGYGAGVLAVLLDAAPVG